MSNWVAMANQLTPLAQRKRRLGQILGQSEDVFGTAEALVREARSASALRRYGRVSGRPLPASR
jgi:hypothetical protein